MYRGIHRDKDIRSVELEIQECAPISLLIEMLSKVEPPATPEGYVLDKSFEPWLNAAETISGGTKFFVMFHYIETDANYARRKEQNDAYWDKREGKTP